MKRESGHEMGEGGYCICPKCEKRTTHRQGIPCQDEKCPACGAPVLRAEGEVAYRCTGKQCPAQLRETIKNFAGKTAMNIDGLGEKLVSVLVDSEMVTSFADLYRLDQEAVAPEAEGALDPGPLDGAPVPVRELGAQAYAVREGLEHRPAIEGRGACGRAEGHHAVAQDPEGPGERARRLSRSPRA